MKIVIDTDARTINNLPNFIPVRLCTVCGQSVGYRLANLEAAIIFDSSCGCSDEQDMRLASWEEVHKFLMDKDKDSQILPFSK